MDTVPAAARVHRGRWWREGEVVLLAALVVGAYFLRGDALTLRGEESRWATVAREMIRTGDWVVPRQQGEPFLSRPPLGNWLIAACALARGQLDVWAVRLPTLTAGTSVSLAGSQPASYRSSRAPTTPPNTRSAGMRMDRASEANAS